MDLMTPNELLNLIFLAIHPSEPRALRDLLKQLMAEMQSDDVEAGLQLIVRVRRFASPELMSLIWERVLAQRSSRDETVRAAASRLQFLLGDRFMGCPPAERPITLLLMALEARDVVTRLRAVKTLGSMGSAARSGLLLLRQRLDDTDPQIRSAAAAALAAIVGQVADQPLEVSGR